MMVTLVNWAMVLVYVAISSVSLVFMRKGFAMAGHHGSLLLDVWTPAILLPLCGYGFSFVMWLVMISRMKLVHVYPIATGLVFIAVLLLSVFIGGESLHSKGMIGSVFILIGILFIAVR